MKWSSSAAALLVVASVARADPVPLEPDSTSVFNEGSNCTIQWDADTTGTWKQMAIELMSGSNLQQVHLKTVVILDATDASQTTYSWTCPAVEPNSAIYFYKFTSPFSTEALFTTRFTIAGPDGSAVTPTASETAANGDPVLYGTGALENPADADEAPNFQGISASVSGTGTPTNAPSGSHSSSSRTSTGTRETETTTSQTGTALANGANFGGVVVGLVGAAVGMFFL